jgi:heptaprenyl diphosphate synthase
MHQGLPEVERELLASLALRDPESRRIAQHLVTAGGKRMRPALLLLVMGDVPPDRRAARAGAAVELIHLASLCHDDIMDRATRRRGVGSVNAQWGNAPAVTVGTLMLARATALLAGLGYAALALGSRQMARLCAGQLREAENAYNLDLSVADHLDILRDKTGALFELAGGLGALLAGRPPAEAAAISTYCGELGLAFQLRDDLMDLEGDPATMGKATGTDIREGVYALSVLLTLAQRGEPAATLRRLLKRRELPDDALSEVPQLLRASGALAQAADLARHHAALARQALDALRPGVARDALQGLADQAVARAA